MQTRYLSLDLHRFQLSELDVAVHVLRSGGIVAFPTETVYGLGAHAENREAIQRLYELKSRPERQPLTFHVPEPEAVEKHVGEIPPFGKKLMKRYWPGPLTLVLPGRSGEPVGFRVPSHSVARALLRQCELTVVATSANPHGLPPAVTDTEVKEYFDGRIEVIIEAGPSALKQASTVVRLEGNSYTVLREGIITQEMVHQLLVGRNFLFVCTGNSCRSPMAEILFRKHLSTKLAVPPEDLRQLGYKIQSAGIFAAEGNPASAYAIQAMEETGCDLSHHRTRPLTPALVEEADRIYALGFSHLRQIEQLYPESVAKVQMLSEFGVTDPIGGDLEIYRQCARDIDRAIQEILTSL